MTLDWAGAPGRQHDARPDPAEIVQTVSGSAAAVLETEKKRVVSDRSTMSPAVIFNLHLVLGYVAWGSCFKAFVWPRLKAAEPAQAHRAIATLHSFRFFGLVFLLPGFVGQNLPIDFAVPAAYGDLATGVIAMLALVTYRTRPLFWLFTVAFNVVGLVDLLVDYYHGVMLGLPERSGELGAAYAIPILYVPLLMITHGAAACLAIRRPATESGRTIAVAPSVD